jgi:hypothetical protein
MDNLGFLVEGGRRTESSRKKCFIELDEEDLYWTFNGSQNKSNGPSISISIEYEHIGLVML